MINETARLNTKVIPKLRATFVLFQLISDNDDRHYGLICFGNSGTADNYRCTSTNCGIEVSALYTSTLHWVLRATFEEMAGIYVGVSESPVEESYQPNGHISFAEAGNMSFC